MRNVPESPSDPEPPVRALRLPGMMPSLPRPLTSFIGRERVAEAIRDMLGRDDVRLVTLTGPGGVGKTRLALRVAGTATAFPGGVWFVDLASLYDPGAVAPAIGRALGVRPAGDRPIVDGIVDVLRERRALLVLDNFEQVLDAAPLLPELLTACPRLTILATSRVALRLTGEQRFIVPPLDLPGGGDRSPGRLRGTEAVRLFVDRASAIAPDFALTDGNAADVAAICARLDGMPLAIELAAARASVFSPADMLKRLDERVPVLAEGPRDVPERLRSMDDSIAWSYELLAPGEQALFRQLGALVGTWTLDAAEAVAGAEDDAARHRAFEGLAALVEASLVRRQADDAGETAYRMLVPIREFAEALLDRSDEAEAVRRRHAAFITALVEEAESASFLPDGAGRLWRLRVHRDNIAPALAWLEGRGNVNGLLRLASAQVTFMHMEGNLLDAHGRLTRAVDLGRAGGSPGLGKGLAGLAVMTHFLGDEALALDLIDEARPHLVAEKDVYVRLWILTTQGLVALRRLETDRSIEMQERALALIRANSGQDWAPRLESTVLGHLGNIAVARGEIDTAERWFDQAIAVQRTLGFEPGTSHVMASHPIAGLGDVARARGDLPLALGRYRDALSLAVDFRDSRAVAYALGGVAGTLAAAGTWKVAARLFGADEVLHERGAYHFELETMDRQRALGLPEPWLRAGESFGAGQPLHDALWGDQPVPLAPIPDPEAAATLWEAGRALGIEAAVAEAVNAQLTEPGPVRDEASGLSAREVEVLRLVAEGKTDSEIAEALFISRRTVATHIRHIYDKLGVSTRAAAAAWAVRNGLA